MIKKIIAGILVSVLALSLVGCGSKTLSILDENGKIHHYAEGEMPEGYTILKDDEFYYQILNMASGTDNLGNVFVWFTEPYDVAIPRLTVKDKLIFYSETARPSNITIYKMTDYGYTLGVMFEVENNDGDLNNPVIISFEGTYNTLSPVQSVVENAVTSGAVTHIIGINNHEFTNKLLVDDSFLKGLTKDTMYQLSMYCGTVLKTVNLKADTHLFLQEATYVTASYKEMRSKYFEITLPSNMSPGYYYAEGIGMFYYEGEIKEIDESEIEGIGVEETETETESLQEDEPQTEDTTQELNDLDTGDLSTEFEGDAPAETDTASE